MVVSLTATACVLHKEKKVRTNSYASDTYMYFNVLQCVGC